MKKLEDYEWMCPEPFTNLFTTTSGHYMPCCAMDYASLFQNHGTEIKRTDKNTIKQYFNSDFSKKLRKAMKENDKNFVKDICKNCIKSEKVGNRSHRQWYLQRFTQDEFTHKKQELERLIEKE